MKRRGVHSLLLAFALVLLQACAWNVTVASPRNENPQSTQTSPEPPFFMRGFSAITESEESQVGYLATEDRKKYASGVLITSRHVLTAGHCADTVVPHWFVSGGEFYRVKTVVVHPQYKINNTVFVDLAILVLDRECSAVPSPHPKQHITNIRGEPLTAVGYGGGIKRKSLPGVFWYYGTLIENPTVFKMLPLDGTVWFGDSGGAIYNNSGVLVGIISSLGFKKGHLYENSAVRIDFFSEWIQKTLENNPCN